ncbi:putative membrane protein YadS [Bradyrhizobium elkanii]|uniref:Membrane protein YadS n=1 Tax=Bradyrhizobium elkanii TaxID=29448 RepID=A0ABV4EVF5_BRAEL|nr:putative membrane protein YadS [Bradyrhizobium elkanii]MCP1981678.1 putative membrane protein YadS [Bradyrhizobium elkanii]MCS3883538.1 putative membrane protein YadS [Bradyrhizobium elkanii]MCS4217405.1 putative membrane protein YadS [Bradyrhizobium elkanii]MCW2196134.1 putative membrane protein YadS [Bradyrhizobium elkanii]
MPEQEQDQGQKQGALRRIFQLIPGILLCGVVTVISLGIQAAEERVFDHPYIEALVVAILLGMAVRTAWEPSARWRSGIAFSAKQLLEVAVTLLGASISLPRSWPRAGC